MIQADGRDSPGYGERWLWCSVLMLAVQDLGARNPKVAEAARAWLFDQRNDAALARVCMLGGVDRHWLRRSISRAGLIQEQRTAA